MRAFRVVDAAIRCGTGSCKDKRGLRIFGILRCSYISFLMSLVIVYVYCSIIVLLYICQVCQSVMRLCCSVQLHCLLPRGNLCITFVYYSFSSFLSINQHSYFVCFIRLVCYPSMSSAPIVRTVALHYVFRLLWFRFLYYTCSVLY